jgi:tetratricopeptide (TPR) repeat protein
VVLADAGGRVCWAHPGGHTENGDPNPVVAVAMIAGRNRAIASHEDGIIRSWDSTDGTLVAEQIIEGRCSSPWAMIVLEDGPFVGTDDGAMHALNPEDMSIRWRGRSGERGTCNILKSAGHDRLVSGHGDGSVVLWRRNDGTVERVFRFHSAMITSLNVVADRWLLSSAMDGRVALVDLDTGALIDRLEMPSPMIHAVVAPSGVILGGDRSGAIRFLRLGERFLGAAPTIEHQGEGSRGDVAGSLEDIGRSFLGNGRPGIAEPFLRGAAEAREAALGASDPVVLASWCLVAESMEQQHKFEEPLELRRRARDATAAVNGALHPLTRAATWNVVDLLVAHAAWSEALPELRVLVASVDPVRDGADDGVKSRSTLAVALAHTGELDEAEALLRAVLDVLAPSVTDDEDGSPQTETDYTFTRLETMRDLASVLRLKGDLDGAVELLREVAEWLNIEEEKALLSAAFGELEEAIEILSEEFKFASTLLGRAAPQTVRMGHTLATWLHSQEDWSALETVATSMLAWEEWKYGPAHAVCDARRMQLATSKTHTEQRGHGAVSENPALDEGPTCVRQERNIVRGTRRRVVVAAVGLLLLLAVVVGLSAMRAVSNREQLQVSAVGLVGAALAAGGWAYCKALTRP